MKKLIVGTALAAAATFGLWGCESRNDHESDLQEAQRELDEAQQREYASPEDRNAAIEEAQQEIREETREAQEEREAYGGSDQEGVEIHHDGEPVDATDINSQELENQ